MPSPVPETVLLAAPRSFRAGVERAIEIVEVALARRGSPVHVRKQIVHNTHVVADLESRARCSSTVDVYPAGGAGDGRVRRVRDAVAGGGHGVCGERPR